METPRPFFYDIKKVKAILLGADPSNNSNTGKTVQFQIEFLSLEPFPTPKEIYMGLDDGIMKTDENWLGRVLIPYYRHYYYS